MSQPWVYRVGLSEKDVSEEALKKSGLKYELVEVESALRSHIDETLGKPYKFYTSMREDAPDFFSCSSLISYLYVFAGISMPSLVIDKFNFFTKPIERGDLQFGDLVFSTSQGKPASHMGMYMSGDQVLHASGMDDKGKVVVEAITEAPLFKEIVGYRRVVDDLKEKRFVVEIPDDRQDLRTKDNLIKELSIDK